MTVARETAVSALLTQLKNNVPLVTTFGRRNQSPDQMFVVGAPSLLILGHTEDSRRSDINMPPIRTMTEMVMIYVNVGTDENAIPDTLLNNILDQVEAALAPDSSGLQTLGNVLYHAYIEGEIIKAPGDISGKALAAVPIKMLLP